MTKVATYAYLRVSTDRQDVDNQRHGILEYANTHGFAPVQCVQDAISGRLAWRERAIGPLLTATATAGDGVIFAEISRMARSTLQVLEMLAIGMERALDKGMSKRSIAKLVGCAESTLYAWLARRHWPGHSAHAAARS
jgi:DNA invertase Pin-like site-specific DNA recombinase